jgi:predicted GH43/DUF377 family glycosyl hydrolase
MTALLGRPCGGCELDTCRLCYLFHHRADYRARWSGVSQPVATGRRSLPCTHLGSVTDRLNCNCSRRWVRGCALHGTTTLLGCADCPDHQPDIATPERTVRISPSRLIANHPEGVPAPPGEAFNPSVLLTPSGPLLVVRRHWDNARIGVCRLGDDLQPKELPSPLNLGIHREDRGSQEDPRLFWFRGRPHVSYTGYSFWGQTEGMVASVCYARLSPDGMRVEQSWYPHLEGRQHWEKNWAFFEWERELFAVHTTAPGHRVLHIQEGRAYPFTERFWSPAWAHGVMRGGAAPVRVGEEFWCFFHAVQHLEGAHQNKRYVAGLYTFEARPPFRPLRLLPVPLLLMEDDTRPKTGYAGPNVVFPGGAYLNQGGWTVACGVHDSYCDLVQFDHDELQRLLQPAADN